MTGAALRDGAIATASGWWAARLTLERTLSPLSFYLDGAKGEEIDEAESLRSWAQGIDARFSRK